MTSCGQRPRWGLVSRRAGASIRAHPRQVLSQACGVGSPPSRSWPISPSFGDPSGTPDARAQPLRSKRIERALQSSAEVWHDRDVNHGGVHARVPEQEVRDEQVPSRGHRHGLGENVEQNSERVIRCGSAVGSGCHLHPEDGGPASCGQRSHGVAVHQRACSTCPPPIWVCGSSAIPFWGRSLREGVRTGSVTESPVVMSSCVATTLHLCTHLSSTGFANVFGSGETDSKGTRNGRATVGDGEPFGLEQVVRGLAGAWVGRRKRRADCGRPGRTAWGARPATSGRPVAPGAAGWGHRWACSRREGAPYWSRDYGRGGHEQTMSA